MAGALTKLSEHLYRFTDTCNVYLLVDGDVRLLIDAGSGAVLPHLHAAGVERVEWVLHTHYHRDQCWGTPRVRAEGARVAVPEYERHLFDQAELFWQTRRISDNYDRPCLLSAHAHRARSRQLRDAALRRAPPRRAGRRVRGAPGRGGHPHAQPRRSRRNSFQLTMHRRCAEVMRRIAAELVCPGHRDVLPWDKREMDAYCDFIARKEHVFRELVGEPADHYVDLFWARLLPYLTTAQPGQRVEYRLLLRNNPERVATFAARLLPPRGWQSPADFVALTLQSCARGEVALWVQAPAMSDPVRRLITAEIQIDGRPGTGE